MGVSMMVGLDGTGGVSMIDGIVGAGVSMTIGTGVKTPGEPSWIPSRFIEVVVFCQRRDEELRSIEMNVREDPKSGVPESVRVSMMVPDASRTVILREVLGMLTAVVMRFGAMVSVVFGSPSA